MDVKYINKDINPCDDFYGFAAGHWADYNQ